MLYNILVVINICVFWKKKLNGQIVFKFFFICKIIFKWRDPMHRFTKDIKFILFRRCHTFRKNIYFEKREDKLPSLLTIYVSWHRYIFFLEDCDRVRRNIVIPCILSKQTRVIPKWYEAATFTQLLLLLIFKHLWPTN